MKLLAESPDYHETLQALQYMFSHIHNRWSMDPSLTPEQQTRVSIVQMFLKKAHDQWLYIDGEPEVTESELNA